MNEFWIVISKLKSIVIFFTVLIIFSVTILGSGFLFLKYYGPVSSKFIGKLIGTILERCIEGTKIEIDHVELEVEDNAVDFSVFDLKVTYRQNTMGIPYLKMDIYVSKVLRGSFIEALSHISISSDIELSRAPLPNNITVKKTPKHVAKSMKAYLMSHIGFISYLPKLLRDINFKIRDADKKTVLTLSLNNLNFTSIEDRIFNFNGDLNAGNDFINFDFSIDTTNPSVIELGGKLNFIPISLLWASSTYYTKIQSNLKLDLTLGGKIGRSGLEYLNFDVVHYHGFIQKNDCLKHDIVPKKFLLSGRISSQYDIEATSVLEADDLTLKALIANKNGKLVGNIIAGKMKLRSVLDYWPSFILEGTRTWLASNLDKGYVTGVDAKINVDLNSSRPLPKESINIRVNLANNIVRCMPLPYIVPVVHINEGVVEVSAEEVVLKLNDATILNSRTNNMVGVVNYKDEQVELVLNGKVVGLAQDIIDIGFAYAQSNNRELKNFKGEVETEIKIVIPLTQEFVLDEKSVVVHSKMKNVSNRALRGLVSLSKFDISGQFIGTKLNIRGEGMVNHAIRASFDLEKNVSNEPGIKTNITVHASIDELKKNGIFKSEIADGELKGSINIFLLGDQYNVSGSFDLQQLALAHPLGIEKKIGEKGELSFSIHGAAANALIDMPTYSLTLPTFSSTGSGILNEEGLVQLVSEKSRINTTDFSFKYSKSYQGDVKLQLHGDEIDLSKINVIGLVKDSGLGKGSSNSFILKTDFKSIILHQGQTFIAPKINLSCKAGKCREFSLVGSFFDNTKINIFYSHPIISIVTDSAYKALSAFGLYDKMEGGTLEFKGEFDEKDLMKGKLFVLDFYIKKAPLLAKLISPLTSFKGLIDILNNKGIYFDKMSAGIVYNKKKVFVDRLVITGPSLHIKCSGVLNEESGKISGEGIIVPSNIINTATKHIPLIGKMLSGGEDSGIIATHFSVIGDIDHMSIIINPFSMLMPGFLGGFFDKEKNFRKKEQFPE
ncbi:MAG: AsmA-like C-terminal domain-containing protein [Candidatus Midichloria sp.]|nr:AsmA-like C-terminal domain-containing protein [Candidatus Midichloria sp.]